MLAASRLLAALTHEAFEPDRVDLVGIDGQGVAAPLAHDDPAAEHPAQVRHERLQRVRRVRRLGVRPQLLDEPTVRHRVRRGQRQQRDTDCTLVPAIGTTSLPTRTSVGPSSATRIGLFIAVPLPVGSAVHEVTSRTGASHRSHAVSATSACAETMGYGVGVDALGSAALVVGRRRDPRAIASASPPSSPGEPTHHTS